MADRGAMTAPGLFEAQVRRTPEAVALACAGTRLSYAELNARANRLAHSLIERGAGPERVVALAMPRGVPAIVALLAVAKAGAAYLPADPLLPAARTDFMLADARPVIVLTDDSGVAAGPDRNVTDADRAAPLRPGCAAYVIYTSGSTGTPKGVVVTQAGLVNLAVAHIAAQALGPGGMVAQVASLSFDTSSGEIWRALGSGATLILPPPGPLGSEQLARLAAEHDISHMWMPPAVLAGMSAGQLAGVRVLTVGGEAVPSSLASPWAAGRLMLVGYGPTETTIGATLYPVRPDDAAAAGALPIGEPITNVRAYVLDERLAAASPGVAGELYVAGAGVARCYHGQPGLTAQRFVACPFGAPGERMYRTGDLARRRADGVLEFAGRLDDQVKVRGFRVELGEVRTALGQAPGVGQAAVIMREDRPGDRRLVGYAVPAPGQRADGVAIRDWLAGRLPDYMVPSAVLVLTGLPLTVNGKLDRAALPAPDYRAGTSAPVPPEQEPLARLFAEVLGVDRVGADDSFFDLGGHSLLAARLAAKISSVLGMAAELADVFEAPTVGALARRLAEGTRGPARPALRPMRRQDGEQARDG